jgi:hypothetical protein
MSMSGVRVLVQYVIIYGWMGGREGDCLVAIIFGFSVNGFMKVGRKKLDCFYNFK